MVVAVIGGESRRWYPHGVKARAQSLRTDGEAHDARHHVRLIYTAR